MSNQAAHYLQSLDRIHRRGQDREVEYIVLLCDGTIEVQEYDRLTAKERASQQLLRDRAPEPVTREAMLAELLRDLTSGRRSDAGLSGGWVAPRQEGALPGVACWSAGLYRTPD